MKRGYAILLVVFMVGILGFANTASAESLSASIQIGEETVPLDLQPVYDQSGNITSYTFDLERSDGALTGEIKFTPPLKVGSNGLLQQDGEETCRKEFTVVVASSGPVAAPDNLGDSFFVITGAFDVNIPGSTVYTAFSRFEGSLTDTAGSGGSFAPSDQSLISAWSVSSLPPANLGVDLGPAVIYDPATPGTKHVYGPYEKLAIGPPGPWTQAHLRIAGTVSGVSLDGLIDTLILDWCPRPSVPTFSQYGYLIFVALVILSAAIFIRRVRKAS